MREADWCRCLTSLYCLSDVTLKSKCNAARIRDPLYSIAFDVNELERVRRGEQRGIAVATFVYLDGVLDPSCHNLRFNPGSRGACSNEDC